MANGDDDDILFCGYFAYGSNDEDGLTTEYEDEILVANISRHSEGDPLQDMHLNRYRTYSSKLCFVKKFLNMNSYPVALLRGR